MLLVSHTLAPAWPPHAACTQPACLAPPTPHSCALPPPLGMQTEAEEHALGPLTPAPPMPRTLTLSASSGGRPSSSLLCLWTQSCTRLQGVPRVLGSSDMVGCLPDSPSGPPAQTGHSPPLSFDVTCGFGTARDPQDDGPSSWSPHCPPEAQLPRDSPGWCAEAHSSAPGCRRSRRRTRQSRVVPEQAPPSRSGQSPSAWARHRPSPFWEARLPSGAEGAAVPPQDSLVHVCPSSLWSWRGWSCCAVEGRTRGSLSRSPEDVTVPSLCLSLPPTETVQ